MRSILMLLAAAAGFGGYLYATHARAGRILENEAAALERVRERRAQPAAAHGYRLAWVRTGKLPALLVARPIERGRDGVRWFAAAESGAVYEFDTVLHRVPADRPDVEALRRYLDRPAGRRPPFGWRRVE